MVCRAHLEPLAGTGIKTNYPHYSLELEDVLEARSGLRSGVPCRELSVLSGDARFCEYERLKRTQILALVM